MICTLKALHTRVDAGLSMVVSFLIDCPLTLITGAFVPPKKDASSSGHVLTVSTTNAEKAVGLESSPAEKTAVLESSAAQVVDLTKSDKLQKDEEPIELTMKKHDASTTSQGMMNFSHSFSYN